MPVDVVRDVFGLNNAEIKGYVDDGIIIRVAQGKYNFRQSAKNMIRVLKHPKGGDEKSANEQFAVERARLYRTKADTGEVELALRRGELGYLADFEKGMTDGIVACKTSLLAIPSKMSPRLALISSATRIEELLESEINHSINILSDVKIRPVSSSGNERPDGGSGDESDEELEAGSSADSKPVGGRKSRALA